MATFLVDPHYHVFVPEVGNTSRILAKVPHLLDELER